MHTVDFLRHILPHDGWICIDIKRKKGFGHRFFRDFDQAAAYVLEQDALGEVVYHACATFKETTSRKQVNVAYLKSLWGDCDVGPGKPYATREQAGAALLKFLADTGLPEPTIVFSGPFGMHLYWVLEAPLTPEQWRPLAEALRELCKRHGFMLDHSRTADQSSVLRPPGTHNRKHGSDDLVTVAHVAPAAQLPQIDGNKRIGLDLHVNPHRAVRVLDHASVYENVPSDAHKIFAGCAQLGNFKDTKGDVPYKLWLYCIWTLHFTIQGDAIAHEYSSGHPDYTYEETQRKLDQASSPIKCATFNELNDLCKSCPYWGKISTPLQLGRSVGRQQELRKTAATELTTIYVSDERGLWVRSEKLNRKGETITDDIKISQWPINLVSVCQGEHDRRDTLMFSMRMPHQGDKQITIPSSVFFSAQGTPEMAGKGAVIHHADHFKDYVRKEMDKYHATHAPQIQYSQFGWKDHDNSFLFGNKLYTQSQTITCVGTPDLERRARMLGPRTGSLAAWSAAANKLFAVGCEPHSFALCCSFGALLMHFLSDEGGAIVNLVSEGSATGKTTGLEAIASVWGELDGTRLTDEDTQVSRGVLLSTLGNLPCVFDELHKRDPDSIRQFITIFTTGRDKLRARPDGTLREAGDWQTILIIGSNISLAEVIQAKNSEEAQAFRVLEFTCEPTFVGSEGDKLRRELVENRGWAGEAFVEYLMQPGVMEEVRADLDRVVAALWDEAYGFDKRHRYWVRCFACAMVAGRIVNAIHMLDFQASRVVGWAIERCQERKDNEGRRDNVHVLNEALYEIWSSTVMVDTEWAPQRMCYVLNAPNPNRGFLARRVRDSGRMYITRTWLRQWLVKHGISRTAFIKDLKARHVIVNDSRFITLGAGTELNTGGQIPCFEIDMHHTDMMGILQAAERDVRGDEKRKKPLLTLLRGGARPPDEAAPSPPSASE